MQLKRRLMMAGATLFIAFAAGHVVQSGITIPFRSGRVVAPVAPPPTDSTPVQIVQLAAKTEPAQMPPLPSVAELAAPILPAPAARPLPTQAAPLMLPGPETPTAAAAPDCTPRLDIAAQPGAMLGLALLAPCRTEERVVIRHAGLAVTGRTSASGALFASLPAMERAAEVSILFAGGETAEAHLDLPEADLHRRFAVQWMGADAFQLHAFENGADFGTPGHVSAADPQAPGETLAPDTGFLTLLGDDSVETPMLAEVYTFPAGVPVVEVVLEAAVTAATCGREILGETLSTDGGTVIVTDLSVSMPGCEAIGEYLLLKNLVPDLKLAAAN